MAFGAGVAVRVLFASLAAPGHAYPLVPLAVAAREAGHDVRFAVGEAVHEDLAVLGLRPFRPAEVFYEIYAEDIEPELTRLRPDLVVHEWGVPGVAVAAARAGIPGLWHGFGRLVPEGIGFEPPTRVTAVPHVDICPPSLQDADFVATAERIELRPVPYPSPSTWERGSRPLVYLTLGTAFGTAELLTTAVAGLSGLDADVVVAAGAVPLAELGRVPHGVTVRPWVPQAAVLARADLVVHHGGSGTTLGALAAGVPQLLLPQGADQFANATALTTTGAATTLTTITAEAIADQARTLLSPGPHRSAVRALADEIAAMPSPAEVAQQLPQLATKGA